jgi:hypothetical protein
MVITRIARFALLAALAFVAAACSSATLTRLAYNNAALAYTNLGPMLTWAVDDYVDLDGSREDWVRVRIDRLLAWHRSEELPRYRGLLESMLAKSARPFALEDIASHQRELRSAYHRLAMQVIPDTAEFLSTMDSGDIAHMERRFAEENRKFLKESVRGTPEERRERRVKKSTGHLESWVGRLSPEQRELVATHYSDLQDLTEELMGERRYRQGEMLALARSRPQRAELEASLKRLFVDTDSWRRPEYKAKLAERDRHLHAMISELSASLTAEQRAHLQGRIRRFLGDITTLTAST